MDGATVVVIGAGPGGLTAAYELIGNSRARVIVLEASDDLGGISKTVEYKGNRIDIGGHRFFSKSDWVMDWWQNILPIDAPDDETVAKASMAIGSQGNVRIETLRAFSEEQYRDLVAALP